LIFDADKRAYFLAESRRNTNKPSTRLYQYEVSRSETIVNVLPLAVGEAACAVLLLMRPINIDFASLCLKVRSFVLYAHKTQLPLWKGVVIMLDKVFEAIARKQLHENAFNRFNKKLDNYHLRRIGAIVKFPNGTEGVDMVKVGASNLKRSVVFNAVVIAAAIAAGKLGSMDH